MSMNDLDSRTVYVGNLSEETTEEILYELLLQAGPLDYITRPKDKIANKFKNFAFVVFKHACSVPYAIHMLDNIRLNGKCLRLQTRMNGAQIPPPEYVGIQSLGPRSKDTKPNSMDGMEFQKTSFEKYQAFPPPQLMPMPVHNRLSIPAPNLMQIMTPSPQQYETPYVEYDQRNYMSTEDITNHNRSRKFDKPYRRNNDFRGGYSHSELQRSNMDNYSNSRDHYNHKRDNNNYRHHNEDYGNGHNYNHSRDHYNHKKGNNNYRNHNEDYGNGHNRNRNHGKQNWGQNNMSKNRY